MAEVQKQFKEFHSEIKLEDENEILREKRKILIDKLRKRLKEMFEDQEEDHPTFTHFNKGGYAMGLGIVPLDSDYDIDVGLEFDLCKDDYDDPVVVKQYVFDALDGHTDDVKIKQPCVTVQYHMNQEPCYHVDFAVYAHESGNSDSIYLAMGKPHSSEDRKYWMKDDPKGLIEKFRNRFDDKEEKAQFRRVIRYLKRWKDIKFSSDGHEAPIGIGIAMAAYHWFTPVRILIDVFANKYKSNDLQATHKLIGSMIAQFKTIYHDGEFAERLVVMLPVEPYCDLFEKMTNLQMENFKEKLETLYDVLIEAENEADPVEACEKLQKQFGDDFPVPEIKETAQVRSPAIVSSSSSG